MISILTGLPRSGKSYRAVWQINETFINPKNKDYKKHHFLYTNIGGFKHDKVNDILDDNDHRIIIEGYEDEEGYHQPDDIIKQSVVLDWEIFYAHLDKLYDMALADKPDEELLRYCRYHKLTPALFVIDEAYRFYTKRSDPVLVWWHGYHGHLGHDIIIIIHRPSLMHNDYKAHTEEFIDAQPKSKALLNNQFRYYFYGTDYYNKKDRYHTDKLTAKPEIFDLYKSGDLHKPKKILYKFIFLAFLALLFVASVLYYFSNSLSERANADENTQQSSQSVNPYDPPSQTTATPPLPPKSPITTSMLLRVRCDAISCSRVDTEYKTAYIPKLYFEEALNMIDSKLLASSTVRIFDQTYNDRLYSIPSDSISYFAMWNVPVVYKREPLGNGSVPSPMGMTQ